MSHNTHTHVPPWSPHIRRATQSLYDKVAHVIPEVEWPAVAPLVHAVNSLKKERNAVILAHNYQTPDIFHCVADFTGDSLSLARQAALANANVIVQAGVRFMAETSKILSPHKTVLLPDKLAGCSLAASITGHDVRTLKQQYPNVPVVSYVNTSADVKAESDICCTSSNAVQVVESLGSDSVIFLPDEYLALNTAKLTNVNIISWNGTCEVHELFTPDDLKQYRYAYPNVQIIAHPECSPDVIADADFSGSTSAMSQWVKTHQPKQVAMITECSMSDNVAVDNPNVEFIRPCNACPHMKRISLKNIFNSLLHLQHEITIPEDVAKRARIPIQRMLDLVS